MDIQLLSVKHDKVSFFLDFQINVYMSGKCPTNEIDIFIVKSVTRDDKSDERTNRTGTTLLGSLTSSIAACIFYSTNIL